MLVLLVEAAKIVAVKVVPALSARLSCFGLVVEVDFYYVEVFPFISMVNTNPAYENNLRATVFFFLFDKVISGKGTTVY